MVLTDERQVLASLREEAALCTELSGLRDEQRQLIEAGEAEQLLDVLARKQRVIDRIGQLEEALKPLKSAWDERRRDFPAAGRVAIGEAFREVRTLLGDLIAKETEDAELLASRKTDVEKEMTTFDHKRRIQSAYHASAAVAESRYIDRTDT